MSLPRAPITKVCTRCGYELDVRLFYWRSDHGGVRSHCRYCADERSIDYQRRHRERVRMLWRAAWRRRRAAKEHAA